MAATDENLACAGVEFGGRQRVTVRPRVQDLQVLPTELCMCSGPRLKAADAIADLRGGARKVDEAIFFLQNRRKAGFRVVLRTRVNAARLEVA